MIKKPSLSLLSLLIVLSTSFSQNTYAQSLEENFKNPPSSAKPRTWMHAMSGNMTKEGLTEDLSSIASAGMGGVLLFNVTQGIPIGPIKYNSPEHLAMIKHAAQECERLGLSFGVHNCDGWSSSGGPWVSPENSMKMVVWRDTLVEGGSRIDIQLPQPTTREGFYRDLAVVAYPALPSELADQNNPPKVTTSDPDFDVSAVTDGRIDNESTLTADGGEHPWIQFEYETPYPLRSVYVVFNDRHTTATLQVSDDGENFRSVRELYKVRTGKGEWDIVDHFEPITSRYFRLLMNEKMTIKEVELSATYTIQNFLGRNSMSRIDDAHFEPIGSPETSMVIPKDDVLDLTEKIDETGRLTAQLPDGSWTIMRFGYTSTGAFNNPASEEGKGLEADKLDRKAFKVHYDAFVKKVVEEVKPVAPRALQYVEIDSYEMGGQNWTDGFGTHFAEKKGYNLTPFLPLIAGRFVESTSTSEAVLQDYRDLIATMMTENYYGYFQELCHRDGLKAYIEPYGFGPLNDLDVGAKADYPMGEFWMNRPITQVASAVSAAHIYGKELVSAESFTSNPEINWKGHPAMAKLSGDRAWAVGINEFMFHRFAHQANTHVEPGMTMNRWGFHFDRTQTWWDNAAPAWFRYIARGSYLLRQGVPVSDLLVFVGDGSPNSTVRRDQFDPHIPVGTNFDCVNADVLLNRLEVNDSALVLPEGTSYEALVLHNVDAIKLSTLRRVGEMAQHGVTIIGNKPQQLFGYQHHEGQRTEFEALVDTIWSKPTTHATYDWSSILEKNQMLPDFQIEGRTDVDVIHRRVGEADVYFLYNPDSVAQTFRTRFRVQGKVPERWNPMNGDTQKLAQFSQEGGVALVDIPLEAEEAVFIVFQAPAQNITTVRSTSAPANFYLTPSNSIEAVVSENGEYSASLSSGNTWKTTITDLPDPVNIQGKWQVKFREEQGYGGTLTLDSLTDWRDHSLDSVKHYSGTATYTTSFTIPSSTIKPNYKTLLDLGQVNIVAEVTLNGQKLGVCWMPPFIVDISSALQEGPNQLEISVTNQWSNRLIGDERYPPQNGGYALDSYHPTTEMPTWYVSNQPMPPGPRSTFTTAPFYKATDELMPSGLIGPVRVAFRKVIEVITTQ